MSTKLTSFITPAAPSTFLLPPLQPRPSLCSHPPKSRTPHLKNPCKLTITATIDLSPPKQHQQPQQTSTQDQLIHLINQAFITKNTTTSDFTKLFDHDCTWETPLLAITTIKDIQENLQNFLTFFHLPTIDFEPIIPLNQNDNEYLLRWMLSFTWPLFWAPRVTFSGRTKIKIGDDGLIKSLEDRWDVKPGLVFSQILPRASDLYWVYSSPHAETNVGVRRVLGKMEGYEVMSEAPRWEVVEDIEATDAEIISVYTVPVLPEDMFCGEVRRMELYSTVQPFSVRRSGDQSLEWSVPVPGRFVGTGGGLPEQKSKNVKIVKRPRKTVAVLRWRGKTLEKDFVNKIKELKAMLIRDGLWREDRKIDLRNVRFHYYNSKAGFNSKGFLSIAAYYILPFIKPLNEVSVDLPDDIHIPAIDTGW